MEDKFSTGNRKILLILPQFQLKFLRFLAVVATIVCLVFYAAIFAFIEYWKHIGVSSGLPETSVFFDFLAQMKLSLGYILSVTLILTVAIILTLGLYMSHRIAGPIFNLIKYLNEIQTKGWVGPLFFRADDFFSELPESINSFINYFKISKQDANDKK
ncbi:MAG: hypothetical protein J0M15_09725 [Deltaproteobacteria bacterium]|jgi:hypothetical protein|nr:hypothetical protein [Deltaproteobacteria bacterium]